MSLLLAAAETGRQVSFRWLGKVSASEQVYCLRDLAYGEHPRQSLDLYLPYAWQSQTGVIFLHGGTWQFGDKSEYAFAAQAFARQGMPVAVVNYRLYPEVRFPAFIDDVALAMAWLQSQGSSYGFPSDRWLLAGHSAGAHIASLVSLDSQYAQRANVDLAPVIGVVCLAGVYSMRPDKDPLFADLFSACADGGYQAMKPVQFLRNGGTPLLMVHGRKDTLVACRSAERMYKNALLAGHPATLQVQESYGHYQPLLDLLPWRQRHQRLMKDIQTFIRTGWV